MEQRTPEWYAARAGKVTASRVADVIAKTKSGPSASRATYMGELIAERLTGVCVERYTNSAMQWGTDTEAEALAAYQFDTTTLVTPVGFCQHPKIEMAGASPDGCAGFDGLLEIKCPNSSTHIDTLLGRSVPAKYVTQMQWQLACTGRKWCDFVSYDPRLPEAMRLFIKRVARDDKAIAELEMSVAEFLMELEAKLAELTALYARKEAA